MSDKAVLEVIKNQTREYNALILQHNTLLKVHTKTVEDFAELDLKAYDLRKDNRDLRKINEKWMIENSNLQESLDGAQREIEVLNNKIQELINDMIEEHDSFEEDI